MHDPCGELTGRRSTWAGKTLRFLLAPYLHWPDTMFTYLPEDRLLFSCDAFGAHFCGEGLFDDEMPDFSFEYGYYFDTIMRPFKDKIREAVAKVEGLDLQAGLPLPRPPAAARPEGGHRRLPPPGAALLALGAQAGAAADPLAPRQHPGHGGGGAAGPRKQGRGGGARGPWRTPDEAELRDELERADAAAGRNAHHQPGRPAAGLESPLPPLHRHPEGEDRGGLRLLRLERRGRQDGGGAPQGAQVHTAGSRPLLPFQAHCWPTSRPAAISARRWPAASWARGRARGLTGYSDSFSRFRRGREKPKAVFATGLSFDLSTSPVLSSFSPLESGRCFLAPFRFRSPSPAGLRRADLDEMKFFCGASVGYLRPGRHSRCGRPP